MSGSDTLSKRVTGTGSLAVGPARIRGFQVTTSNAGAGRLTITKGNGGAVAVDIDFGADTSDSVFIPDEGVRVSDIYVSLLTNITSVTIFYN